MNVRLVLALAVCAGLALAACAQKAAVQDGYRAEVVPGITRDKVESILGKPATSENFQLPHISAYVLTYPFGDVVLQHDRVVAVTVATDPVYVGPLGIKVGTSESDLRTALLAARGPHSSYRDSYQVTSGDLVTRTRDVYDDTDHVLFELAAANPNDAEAAFSVVSVTLTNAAGSALMSSVTKAKVQGSYPGQNIVNFVSEPWPTRKGP